jgi:hypothetical protein
LSHERFEQSTRACIEEGINVLQARLEGDTLYAEPLEVIDDDQDFNFELDDVLADLADDTMNADLPILSWMFNELCAYDEIGSVYIYLDVTVPIRSLNDFVKNIVLVGSTLDTKKREREHERAISNTGCCVGSLRYFHN